MKKTVQSFLLIICLGILLMGSSCAFIVHQDSGKHAGWYKNQHNPHNPVTTNPGKQKIKGRR
jgi:hypothetical protein